MRNTKTEYVSCPSCGRTLFDLQEVTEQIRTQTGHLPGVSIAVMGCIVNGPGEMADADFGCALTPVLECCSLMACTSYSAGSCLLFLARLHSACIAYQLRPAFWQRCTLVHGSMHVLC